MKIIVGLGNPTPKYRNNYHNLGFMTVDALAEKLKMKIKTSECKSLTAVKTIDGGDVVIAKPQTFMNLSGNSVGKAALFYKIPPEKVIVIHDDLDLKVGQIKAKLGGGAGGHNGLKSIDAAISPNYNRIRIGVGHPQGGGEAVVNHVLSRFSKADAEVIEKNIQIICETLPILLKDGMAKFSGLLGMMK